MDLQQLGGVTFTVGILDVLAMFATRWDASREARKTRVVPGSSYAARQFGRQAFLTFVVAITVSPLIGTLATFFFDAARDGAPWGGASLVSLIITVLLVSAYLLWRTREAIEDDHGHPATIWRDVDDQNETTSSGRSAGQWGERLRGFSDSVAGGHTVTEREVLKRAVRTEWTGCRGDLPTPHVIAQEWRGNFPQRHRSVLRRSIRQGSGLILASGGSLLIAAPSAWESEDTIVQRAGMAGVLVAVLVIAAVYACTARSSNRAKDMLRLTRQIHFHITCFEAEAAIERLAMAQLQVEEERREWVEAARGLERAVTVLEAMPMSRLRRFVRRSRQR